MCHFADIGERLFLPYKEGDKENIIFCITNNKPKLMNIAFKDKVVIKRSNQLEELKLSDLVHRTGVIIEDLTHHSRKSKGYMILLDVDYQGEQEWFIPLESIKKL